MDIAEVSRNAGESVLKFYESPPCPRFPALSLVAGYLSQTFRSFLVWMGLPLGPLSNYFFLLHWRAEKVRWALKPREERMKALFSVGLIGIALPFLMGGHGGLATVKMIYQRRPSRSA